jgi:hypothetical protein
VVVAGEWGRGDDVERFWKGIGGREMNGEELNTPLVPIVVL